MKAIRKSPSKVPELIEIENILKALQEQVGGYIETVGIATNAVIICNEEGLLQDLPLQKFLGHVWAGPILVVGVDGEEFCDVPEATIRPLLSNYWYKGD